MGPTPSTTAPARGSPAARAGAPDSALSLQEALSGALALFVREPEAFETLPVVAAGRRSRLARLAPYPVLVKRYVHPRAFVLRTWLRRSLAEREARASALVLAALPDNPVSVLAWAEDRRLGCVPRCYVVSRELEESYDLRRLKSLAPSARSAAVGALISALPARVAALHAAGVFALTLRGKNVLHQPATGRVALIDLPYARRPRRLRLRHRAYDLASLSLELLRTFSEDDWGAFVAAYVEAAHLTARDAARLAPARLARVAARIAHRTPVSAASSWVKRRFRHSQLGQWVTGHRYPAPDGRSHA